MTRRMTDEASRNARPPPEPRAALDRRGFLALLGAALAGGLGVGACARPAAPARRLRLHHVATGESLEVAYWTSEEGYRADALERIDRLLRDHHNGQIKPIDPRLLDQLHALQATLAPRRPILVVSGYRSPETNARLRRSDRRVAARSYHLRGQAADIRIPGCEAVRLQQAALALAVGGVGYYPDSSFVHVDSGPVRAWRG